MDTKDGIKNAQTYAHLLPKTAPGNLPIMTGWGLKFFPPDGKSGVSATALTTNRKRSRWANNVEKKFSRWLEKLLREQLIVLDGEQIRLPDTGE